MELKRKKKKNTLDDGCITPPMLNIHKEKDSHQCNKCGEGLLTLLSSTGLMTEAHPFS